MSRVSDMPVKDLDWSQHSKVGHPYSCPVCNEPPKYDKRYTANFKTYPEYCNHRSGFNGDCDYDDWDEVHYCRKCKIEYWFTNGAY